MAEPKPVAPQRALVIPRHRHLKWKALDPLEALLMILCGICMAGFTLCVLFDVVTREIGRPWLWLQQVTTAFFAWGVFVGMAAATRRLDHIYLSEITRRMTGTSRLVIETVNRVIVLIIAGFMIGFGIQNALLDLGSFRMPSLIPLTVYTAVVPITGLLVAIFMVEQIVNGWNNGFEGPEDTELTQEPVP
jgi:TRAP-type C4-dicarboxylate transport system permease small subunit